MRVPRGSTPELLNNYLSSNIMLCETNPNPSTSFVTSLVILHVRCFSL